MPKFAEIAPEKWRRYEFLVDHEGWTRIEACQEVGISPRTAQYHDRQRNVFLQRGPRPRVRPDKPGARIIIPKVPVNTSGDAYREARAESLVPPPIPLGELCAEAKEALDDFEYFRLRYFGHVSVPWQVETAAQIVEWSLSPETVMAVENVFPGAGKSTLRHDIAAWLTARNRQIRGAFGSRKEGNAMRDLLRLRRSLERTTPPKAKPFDRERGLAVDAEACLAMDYGSFKPLTREVWQRGEFIVAQYDNETVAEREPTWSCYGVDSGLLSNRFEFIAWDDVDDKATLRSMDAVEQMRGTWDDECESRLEEGGLLWVIQQRLAAHDMSRYCLDKKVPADEDDEEEEGEMVPLYRHIVYKAHYEERCQGEHTRDAPAYPHGCLLDPKRGPWHGPKGLRAISITKPRNYRLQYQQEDVEAEDVLVPELWITGGSNEAGEVFPGCWDPWRGLCELPQGLAGPLYSVATVDPSGKKMWAVEWLIHAPEAANQTFLMDLERKAMPANELLDWDANRQQFYGLMEEWQERSVILGHPITTWIVEINAAQRYLLQYDHVRRWMAKWGVSIIGHTTGPRKLDDEHGPWIIRDHFRRGGFRIPGKQAGEARIKSMKLVDELTRWPNPGITDDLVMACWFFFVHQADIVIPPRSEGRAWRPRWVRHAS